MIKTQLEDLFFVQLELKQTKQFVYKGLPPVFLQTYMSAWHGSMRALLRCPPTAGEMSGDSARRLP